MDGMHRAMNFMGDIGKSQRRKFGDILHVVERSYLPKCSTGDRER